MKIAFLSIYNGIVERGSEVFVTELAGKLSEKFDISVFQTGSRNNEKYKTVLIKGIQFYPHQGYKTQGILYDLFVFVFTIKSLIIIYKDRYDWVVPINGRWQSSLIRMMRVFLKYKILITGHAGIGLDDWWNLRIGKPDIFVALSEKAKKWALNLSSMIRIEYIPNGIDIKKFGPFQKQINLYLEKPVVLCVSALVDYKRIDLVVNAVSNLKEVSLLVIGDGPMRDKIKALGEKLLGTRFKLISKVDQNRMPEFYRSADLFTLPSKDNEAFGIVYLEALASNIPVVAPNDENRRQIIGKGGLYCDVENIEQYSRTIREALKEGFGDSPRKQAEKYSWDTISGKYSKLLAGG